MIAKNCFKVVAKYKNITNQQLQDKKTMQLAAWLIKNIYFLASNQV